MFQFLATHTVVFLASAYSNLVRTVAPDFPYVSTRRMTLVILFLQCMTVHSSLCRRQLPRLKGNYMGRMGGVGKKGRAHWWWRYVH